MLSALLHRSFVIICVLKLEKKKVGKTGFSEEKRSVTRHKTTGYNMGILRQVTYMDVNTNIVDKFAFF